MFTPDVFEWEAAVKVKIRELSPPTGHTDTVAPERRVQFLINISSIFKHFFFIEMQYRVEFCIFWDQNRFHVTLQQIREVMNSEIWYFFAVKI